MNHFESATEHPVDMPQFFPLKIFNQNFTFLLYISLFLYYIWRHLFKLVISKKHPFYYNKIKKPIFLSKTNPSNFLFLSTNLKSPHWFVKFPLPFERHWGHLGSHDRSQGYSTTPCSVSPNPQLSEAADTDTWLHLCGLRIVPGITGSWFFTLFV